MFTRPPSQFFMQPRVEYGEADGSPCSVRPFGVRTRAGIASTAHLGESEDRPSLHSVCHLSILNRVPCPSTEIAIERSDCLGHRP